MSRETAHSPAKSPLAGVCVVLTRPLRDSAGLAALLESLGARVQCEPLISIETRGESAASLREALARLTSGDWIAFSSANAVRTIPSDVVLNPSILIATVGPGTSREVTSRGWAVALEAQRNDGIGLEDALLGHGLRGRRVLIPQSDLADDGMAKCLARTGGAECIPIKAYTTKPDAEAGERILRQAIACGRDNLKIVISLASPSAVNGLTLGGERLARDIGSEATNQLLRGLTLIAIGNRTASAIRAAKLSVGGIAAHPTDQALSEAIIAGVKGPSQRPDVATTP